MHTFPDVVITGPDYSIWLWLLVPVVGVVVFWGLEHLIERITEKRFGKPFIGVGYILMGVCLFVIPMSIPAINDYQETTQIRKAISALEGIGFDEVRMAEPTGSFGAYYGDELLRGAVVPDPYHDNTYFVIETPRPAND